MPFQPVNATALAELVYSLDGQIVENTLYFRDDQDFNIASLANLGAAMVDWWTTEMAPNLADALTLLRVVCTALHDQTGPQVIVTGGLPAAGAIPSDPVPNNCAYCVSFRTSLIGRPFRGRNYVPGLPESATNISRLSQSVSNSLVAAYQALLGNTYTDLDWVVVTRTVNHVVQGPTALTNPVISVVAVDLVMDSQRRRLPGRGQ